MSVFQPVPCQSIKIGSRLLTFESPKVMGILNLTPDSFYDGGKHSTVESALIQAEKLIDEGVDMIDIGAYSSRPGAKDISEQEEFLLLNLSANISLKSYFLSTHSEQKLLKLV